MSKQSKHVYRNTEKVWSENFFKEFFLKYTPEKETLPSHSFGTYKTLPLTDDKSICFDCNIRWEKIITSSWGKNMRYVYIRMCLFYVKHRFTLFKQEKIPIDSPVYYNKFEMTGLNSKYSISWREWVDVLRDQMGLFFNILIGGFH